MMVRIRLKRFGAKKRPYYRIVVMDARTGRDGRSIEELGFYRPVESDRQFKIDENLTKKWLQRGAVPSDTVRQIFNRNGVTCGRR